MLPIKLEQIGTVNFFLLKLVAFSLTSNPERSRFHTDVGKIMSVELIFLVQ